MLSFLRIFPEFFFKYYYSIQSIISYSFYFISYSFSIAILINFKNISKKYYFIHLLRHFNTSIASTMWFSLIKDHSQRFLVWIKNLSWNLVYFLFHHQYKPLKYYYYVICNLLKYLRTFDNLYHWRLSCLVLKNMKFIFLKLI